MLRNFREVIVKNCEGCRLEYPSQLDHDCIANASAELLQLYFWVLFDSVNEEEANELCKKRMIKFLKPYKQYGNYSIIKEELRNDIAWIEKLRDLLPQWLHLKEFKCCI